MHFAMRTRYTITLDDDPLVHQIIEKVTGIPSISFDNSSELIERRKRFRPVAVFIDVNLGEGMSGLDCIPPLAKHWPYAPIIVITSNPTEEVVSEALTSGAQDFIHKPIRPKELLARYQVRLAEAAKRLNQRRLQCADIVLDMEVRRVEGRKLHFPLSRTGALLLQQLIHSRGSVVSREALKKQAWKDFITSDNSLHKRVHEVRRALDATSSCLRIRGLYGKGFVLESLDKSDLVQPAEIIGKELR